MTSTYSPLLRGDHFVSRDLCPASLVERTRLAGHKQSFLNLLRQNGRHVTKVCWIWNETDVLSVLINPYRLVGRPHKLPYVMPVTQFKLIKWKKINAVLLALFCSSCEKKAWKKKFRRLRDSNPWFWEADCIQGNHKPVTRNASSPEWIVSSKARTHSPFSLWNGKLEPGRFDNHSCCLFIYSFMPSFIIYLYPIFKYFQYEKKI